MSFSFSEEEVGLLLHAVQFASEKHKSQRRKDEERTPYINHPLNVAKILWEVGNIRDIRIIIAGILHDTIEDTQTTSQEITAVFGNQVCAWVEEVTDDKRLPKQERKRLQIEYAPFKSHPAKQIKLADKISNVLDIARVAPVGWSVERQKEYVDWAKKVVEGLGCCNRELEKVFEQATSQAYQSIEKRKN